jgi:hypothetical protein
MWIRRGAQQCKGSSEIAFVTLAESGCFDGVTAGENKELVSAWKLDVPM